MTKIISVQKELKSILRDERGAVKIEWVVLTAGVIALGIAA
jgi:Flp pilus assembly pilin Flp